MSVRRHLIALLAAVSLIAALTISSASIASAIPPPPAAPASLVAYPGNGSAEIGFIAGASVAPVTNYKYSTDNGSSWTAFSPAVKTPTVTIGGLTNGTTYSVKLRAVSSVGDGSVSDAVLVTPADVNAISWTGRTAPETNNWKSVVFGNGLFVAVASTGTNRVMTSTDGVTWTARAAAEANEWSSVTYANGLFVAVAQTGTNRVMTSSDGVTWTARSAASASYWVTVTYGNGLFVAVASSSSAVMTSPDGITWTARTGAASNYWHSVTFGNGLFVAVASSGGLMTSPDGVTWTSRSAAEANNWFGVTYAKGTFVAVANNGTNRVMTSSNGTSWTAHAAPGDDESWQSLTYGNGNFVATSYSKVMYSTDGSTWTIRPGVRQNWGGITYGKGTFVAVADGNSPSVMTAGLTAPAAPDAPTSLAATIGKGSASVAFTAGADGGSSITNYEYQLDGAGAWTALSPADAYSPVTIPGLTNDTSYTVKLRAVNAIGSGAASAASAPFTPLLRMVCPSEDGTVSILAGTGSPGTPTPGTATSSALGGLNGLAVDPSGNVFIADNQNNRVYRITPGGILSVFAGTGAAVDFFSAPPAITPGPATSADLAGPSDVAVDAAGNVYVAVTSSRQVVKITPAGTLSIVAGTGTWVDPSDFNAPALVLVPGPATGVDLNRPSAVAVDAAGNLYIADTGYQQILKVTTGGTLSVVAGTGSYSAPTPGPATSSDLGYPTGIAVDASGTLYIADAGWGKVLKVTSGGTLSIFAGTGSSGLPTPGPATSSALGGLNGVAVDADGNVFITDSTNNVIEKVTAAGALTVVAGTGYRGTPTPGPVADSELGSTERVATDSTGNIYILDSSYYLLEKVQFVHAPSAPTSLVATPGNGTASVAFSAGSDGGASITKYQYSTDGGSTWFDADAGTTSPVSVSGLTNGTTYSLKLRAVNSVGNGSASAGVSVTPRTVPSAPTSLVPTPGNGTVSVAFTAGSDGGSAITNYEYQLNGSGSWYALSPAATGSPVSISVTNGVAYTVKLRAVNAAGSGTASVASASFTPATTPSAPTSLVATPGNGTASVAFSAGSDGGASITKYQYSTDGGSTWFDADAGTTSPVTVSGLTNGTTYSLQLRAVNSVGSGTASVASASFTLATTPSAPTGLVATPDDESASISFTAGSDGGAEITKYEYSTDGGTTWSDADVGTTSPVTVSGLTNYTAYSIELRAVNSIGAGAASTAVSVTPVNDGSSTVSVTASGRYRLLLQWSEVVPSAGSVVRYRGGVFVKGTMTKVASCLGASTDRSCSVNGAGKLSPGTTYDVRVRARVLIDPGPAKRGFWTLWSAALDGRIQAPN